MSSFTDAAVTATKKKMDWAAVGDSSDEEDNEEEEEVEEEENEEDDDDDDDDDSDDDEDEDTTRQIGVVRSATETAKPKERDVTQLSKKERKELRMQELDDLDSMLAEFGTVSAENHDSNAKSEPVEVTTTEGNDGNDDKKVNKKKKKKSAASKQTDVSGAPSGEIAAVTPKDDQVDVFVDVAAVLKNKLNKQKSGKKAPTVPSAAAVALKEAAGGDGKKKKKKDNAKFSEYSY